MNDASHSPQVARPAEPPIWVDTPQALAAMRQRLARESVVAVDTESNSLYAYCEKVCLVQFSIPGADYLLDPLALTDLATLKSLFADPAVEKVFHAAEYDVMALKRDHGFEFVNLFDTMLASRILGWTQFGLGNILAGRFGVRQDKRMQRHDWGRRPLSAEELEYARLDTYYLLPLREILLAELQATGLLTEAREMFAELTHAVWQGKTFDPGGFWRIKGARRLAPPGLAVLRELYLWRDREARRRDRPPFKVLGDVALLRLAQTRPGTPDELSHVRGLTPHLVRRYGRAVLQAITRGQRAGPPSRPRGGHHTRPDPQIVARYEALRAWRKRRAAQRGVEHDVILSNAALMALARRRPRTWRELDRMNVMGPVKREKYGLEILRVLRAEP